MNREETAIQGISEKASGPDGGPTLCVCMIVKNEEKCLARCLDSVKDYADEMVIVDTGSSDRTVAIARQYTDKVYIHPWEDSFSKARNHALQYVTTDWILEIDADEVLMPGSGPLLREAIQDSGAEGFLVNIVNAFNDGASQASVNRLQLFRNKKTIRYVGIVHNRLEGCTCSRALPIRIFHDGYDLDPETMQRKFQRTTSLLKKQVEENPDDPMPHHYLCASYLSNCMYDQAAKEGIRAIELAESQQNDDLLYVWTHFMTGAALLNLRQLDETEEYAVRGLRKYAENLDSYFLLALVYYERKDWPRLLEAAGNYLRVQDRVRNHPEEFGTLVIVSANDEWRVRLYLGAAYWEMGNRDKTQEQYDLAVEAARGSAACYKSIGSYHFRRREWDLARKYTDLALAGDREDPAMLYAKAKLCSIDGDSIRGEEYLSKLSALPLREKDASLLSELGVQELREGNPGPARLLLNRARELSPDNPENLVNLGLACKKSGKLEEAVVHYERALEIDPEGLEAMTNLGHLQFERGDLTRASECLERALALDEGALDVHLRLAQIAVAKCEIETAVARCDSTLRLLALPRNRVLESCDDLSELFGQIGDLLVGDNRGSLGVLAFEVSVALHSSPDVAACRAAEVLTRKGNYQAALGFLETMVRAHPGRADSFRLLGECYAKLQVTEAAALCFAQARELARHEADL